jgi:hypothetical protein
MLFSKSIWKVSPALLAMAALILITGVAGAVFNADRSIEPNSPNFNGSGGWVDGSGENYSTGVYFSCGGLNDSFEIGCYSEHPDNVTISSNQGKVDQKKTDNNARAYMNVAELGGITVNDEFDLDCKKVQLKGKSNDTTERIESKCTLTKCQIPGAFSPNQIASAQQCIEEQEDAGNIGKKVTSLKLDNNNLLKGKIWSRGVWQEGF